MWRTAEEFFVRKMLIGRCCKLAPVSLSSREAWALRVDVFPPEFPPLSGIGGRPTLLGGGVSDGVCVIEHRGEAPLGVSAALVQHRLWAGGRGTRLSRAILSSRKRSAGISWKAWRTGGVRAASRRRLQQRLQLLGLLSVLLISNIHRKAWKNLHPFYNEWDVYYFLNFIQYQGQKKLLIVIKWCLYFESPWQ